MGHRKIMRVPMAFDAPKEVWEGYLCHRDHHDCDICEMNKNWGCHNDPPSGPGWQLWETTSAGSPVSPVFATPEELAEWCESNATFFADIGGTKEEWLRSILGDLELDSLAVVRSGHPMTVVGKMEDSGR